MPQRASKTKRQSSVARPYPVVHGEAAEVGDALSPLHQQEELLLHGLAHVPHLGHLLGVDVTAHR